MRGSIFPRIRLNLLSGWHDDLTKRLSPSSNEQDQGTFPTPLRIHL